MTPRDLDGRVAVVTGAARGIGAAIARRLAAAGATVAMADRADPTDWATTRKEVAAAGRAATAHHVDIRSTDSCRELFVEVTNRHGGLDILVNNAGVNAWGPAATTSEQTWQQTLDVNLSGTFRMCQQAHTWLAASPAASVVNLTSTAGRLAIPGCVAYAVSKAGIDHLTRLLALEWSDDGIRVNAVAPTIVPTDMNGAVRADPEYLTNKIASIPLGRMVRPEEVADSVAFLASPSAAMITGHTVLLDGGAALG